MSVKLLSAQKKAVRGRDMYAVILAGGSGTRFWPLSREMLSSDMIIL